MQNTNPFYKGITLFIITLFIGISIIPSTIGTNYNSLPTLENTRQPKITDLALTVSNPLDTEPGFGWENFTCIIIDKTEIDTVQLNITWPDLHTDYHIMNKRAGTYYYNTTLTQPGGIHTPGYTYTICATNILGNDTTTPSQEFKLPMNEDISCEGTISFLDIISVMGCWGATGPPGWIRADVNNDGIIDSLDISMYILPKWGQVW